MSLFLHNFLCFVKCFISFFEILVDFPAAFNLDLPLQQTLLGFFDVVCHLVVPSQQNLPFLFCHLLLKRLLQLLFVSLLQLWNKRIGFVCECWVQLPRVANVSGVDSCFLNLGYTYSFLEYHRLFWSLLGADFCRTIFTHLLRVLIFFFMFIRLLSWWPLLPNWLFVCLFPLLQQHLEWHRLQILLDLTNINSTFAYSCSNYCYILISNG